MIVLRYCSIADRDHRRSCRQYAHTNHFKNTICVTQKWRDLPYTIQMGLIAHEVGHIACMLAGEMQHTEKEADQVANVFFKVRIKYKNSKYGERLQYLSLREADKIYVWWKSGRVI